MSQIVWATLAPHTKAKFSASDFLLYPDDEHDIPDDVDAQEREWRLKLGRLSG